MPAPLLLKKTIALTLFIFLLIGRAHSIALIDDCVLYGQVRDSLSTQALPFASVQLFAEIHSDFTLGVLTDGHGKYIISDIEPGKYKLLVSYMGYHSSEVVIDIQNKKTRQDVFLQKKEFSLDEVEISAEKRLIETAVEKTTINVSKNTTLTGGSAVDVIQSIPSVDIDVDGKIHYRGSDRVTILLNGVKSELVKSLDQIPADQVMKVELINNPSVSHEAEGMSGIINIVLKSGSSENKNATVMLNLGYPETLGANIGYSGKKGKTSFFVNAGYNHKTKFQTKEHFRENYENPNAFNYYQYDRQDERLNNLIVNTNLGYAINKNQQLGITLIGSAKNNFADRKINYKTLNKNGSVEYSSLKDIDIYLNNFIVDGNLNYRYSFRNSGQALKANIHYSILDQLHEMDNTLFYEVTSSNPGLQHTDSKQLNKNTDYSLDYIHPLGDSTQIETGYNYNVKDLLNDFYSESYNYNTKGWMEDTSLSNIFHYVQKIQAIYINAVIKLKFLEIQAGIRAEYTNNKQDNTFKDDYFNVFPSISVSGNLNNSNLLFASYSRRINRPTIKMLNPFTDEYADLLNMHIGNPDLKPEFVNSIEIGNRFIINHASGSVSVYFRDIDQAISRIKSASNDSALIVTFMNLEQAKLLGAEVSLMYKPYAWWSINMGTDIFYTSLKGIHENNIIDKSLLGWNTSVFCKFEIPYDFDLQLSAYYRSELPSVMGTYIERYYMDLALSKKILDKKARLVFKLSDVFNTYAYGLDLDAVDDNNYRYSQSNRRKNESQYFIVSFIYNIKGKKDNKSQKKQNFYLESFDK